MRSRLHSGARQRPGARAGTESLVGLAVPSVHGICTGGFKAAWFRASGGISGDVSTGSDRAREREGGDEIP